MAKSSKKDISLVALADQLETILDKKEALKAKLVPIEEKEEKIRQTIVNSLLANGLQYIKTSSGLSFGIVQGRKTYEIVKEKEAIEWAQESYPGLLTLRKADLAKVLKPMLSVPPFFAEKVGEPHLAVRTQE